MTDHYPWRFDPSDRPYIDCLDGHVVAMSPMLDNLNRLVRWAPTYPQIPPASFVPSALLDPDIVLDLPDTDRHQMLYVLTV